VTDKPIAKIPKGFIHGECDNIQDRKISLAMSTKYDYQIGVDPKSGRPVHIAPYYDAKGNLVSQKIRYADAKGFYTTGVHGDTQLFGQKLWKSAGGKRLVITEGEIDALSVCQTLGGTWPVVSLTNGSSGVAKDIKNNIEFIISYDEIVLCFDNDEPGLAAQEKALSILPPGKVRVVSLPEGYDPNKMLQEGRGVQLKNAIYEAKLASPDEILHVSDVVDAESNFTNTKVYPYPFDSLSEFLIGQRSGEIVLWTSGTGSGKSTILRAVAMDHLQAGRKVGMIMLEESPQETLDDLISVMLKKPVRQIRAQRMMNSLRESMGKPPLKGFEDNLSEEEYNDARADLNSMGLFIYDHLGNNAMTNLMSRMEYLATSLECDVILLDHITAAATGMMNSNTGLGDNERLIIDDTMKNLRGLVARTGCLVHIVSQLRKTDKAYEEGARITLQDLRGSGSLSSVPNSVIALERNRQDPDPVIANTTKVRLLKDRLTGRAGLCPAALYWDAGTHTLQEMGIAQGADGKVSYDPDFSPV
jgi:twinkle protein